MNYFYIAIVTIAIISCNVKGKKQQVGEINQPIVELDTLKLNSGEEEHLNMYMHLSPDKFAFRIPPYDEPETNRKKLDLQPISEAEYCSIDSTYTRLNSRLIENTDSTFGIKVKNEIWRFKKEPKVEDMEARANINWSEYIGYYPDLSIHAVRSCFVSGDLHGFADVFLIDEKTGCKYYLVSGGDYCAGTPILSPNSKYMAIIDNTYDDDLGYVEYIKVVAINKELSEYFVYFNESNSLDLKFNQIIWLTDREFVAKGYVEQWLDDKRTLRYTYYKVYLQ